MIQNTEVCEYEAVVCVGGNFVIFPLPIRALIQVTTTLRKAMSDTWGGQPPYFCDFNPFNPGVSPELRVYATSIRSDRIDGFYVRERPVGPPGDEWKRDDDDGA